MGPTVGTLHPPAVPFGSEMGMCPSWLSETQARPLDLNFELGSFSSCWEGRGLSLLVAIQPWTRLKPTPGQSRAKTCRKNMCWTPEFSHWCPRPCALFSYVGRYVPSWAKPLGGGTWQLMRKGQVCDDRLELPTHLLLPLGLLSSN